MGRLVIFVQILVGGDGNFTYIFGDERTREAAVVDPGYGVEEVLTRARLLKVDVKYIFCTHSHADHTGGNSQLKKETGARVVMHTSAPLPKDIAVTDQDHVKVGNLVVRVIHTPGHTHDSICLLVDKKLFTGDTLFVGECGRTDLPGGSSKDMYYSLFSKILSLDDSIEVYPGHNYGERPSSTIEFERKTNHTLEKRTLEEFIQFMKEP
ncbi:MAG: hydroxyacylglutathione hydrolase [Candidatus Bathyarchaeota archaeon BA1]|nr:MAG: hydroxyacylglutathione hydrolase [Candidatus Bathyarchaeota archaeon BA1]